MLRKISFPGTSCPEIALKKGSELSRELDVNNSPVLFGCRTGICGTCLIEVSHTGEERLPEPSPEEKELLELVAPGNPRARLACQIRLTADLAIKKLEAG